MGLHIRAFYAQGNGVLGLGKNALLKGVARQGVQDKQDKDRQPGRQPPDGACHHSVRTLVEKAKKHGNTFPAVRTRLGGQGAVIPPPPEASSSAQAVPAFTRKTVGKYKAGREGARHWEPAGLGGFTFLPHLANRIFEELLRDVHPAWRSFKLGPGGLGESFHGTQPAQC
jgi:hypothetical protein